MYVLGVCKFGKWVQNSMKRDVYNVYSYSDYSSDTFTKVYSTVDCRGLKWSKNTLCFTPKINDPIYAFLSSIQDFSKIVEVQTTLDLFYFHSMDRLHYPLKAVWHQ